MKLTIEQVRALLNKQATIEPVCHCGSPMEDHGYSDGHSAVEMPQQADASTDEVMALCQMVLDLSSRRRIVPVRPTRSRKKGS